MKSTKLIQIGIYKQQQHIDMNYIYQLIKKTKKNMITKRICVAKAIFKMKMLANSGTR